MNAILIMPGKQAVGFIDISGCGDIRNIIGYNTIEYDAIGNDGNCLFFLMKNVSYVVVSGSRSTH